MYLFPPNANWQSEFENEKELIVSNYKGDMDVFHIGSTAIDGLYAKDCIDLLGVVKDITKVKGSASSIIDLGYVYKGEYGISGREYFSKVQRKSHLHIFQYGDKNIEKHLNFVRLMQGNKTLITELNQIKQELHLKYPHDRDAYQSEKAFFYHRINKLLD